MLFIAIVLSIPVFVMAIWGLTDPYNAMMFMDRWRYNEDPEFSELQMKMFKWGNIAAIVFAVILIIYSGIVIFTPEEPLPEIPDSYYNSP